jgi:hypothetical protein
MSLETMAGLADEAGHVAAKNRCLRRRSDRPTISTILTDVTKKRCYEIM